MDVRKYWAKVREIEASFGPGCPFITSFEDEASSAKAGVVTQATSQVAAEAIINRSHRLSTPEEIEAWHERQREHNHALETKRLHDDGRYIVQAAQQKGTRK